MVVQESQSAAERTLRPSGIACTGADQPVDMPQGDAIRDRSTTLERSGVVTLANGGGKRTAHRSGLRDEDPAAQRIECPACLGENIDRALSGANRRRPDRSSLDSRSQREDRPGRRETRLMTCRERATCSLGESGSRRRLTRDQREPGGIQASLVHGVGGLRAGRCFDEQFQVAAGLREQPKSDVRLCPTQEEPASRPVR